jgi:transcriptional regulator with XRE-family HTH domain
MRLNDYLEASGTTPSAFARRLGVSSETVRRYCEGTRIPRPEIMRRIVEATDNKVTPNDFFETEAAA